MNHVNIAKLNVHHLGCKYRLLSIQYSQPSIKKLANCIFRVNGQIFDSPIIPRIRYYGELDCINEQQQLTNRVNLKYSSYIT